jgi:hypothetical protein
MGALPQVRGTPRKNPFGVYAAEGVHRTNFTLAICASHLILVRCGSFSYRCPPWAFPPWTWAACNRRRPLFYFNSVIQFSAQAQSPSRFCFLQSGNSAPPNKRLLLRRCREQYA